MSPSQQADAAARTATATTAREWRSPTLMLVMATLGFGLNFWAWALISPLGPAYRDDFDLSSFQQSLLVAVPVLVGSLGRIPVGALTDRLGGRLMFPLISFATIVPVLFVAVFGDSYAAVLVGGFFLGIGGTAFAVGVPFVNAWYPPERRGFALGIFGVGMGGTAVSAFTTVKLADNFSRAVPFTIVAVVLAVYGVVAALVLRDAPGARTRTTTSFLANAWATFKMKVTLQMAFLYAVSFGGFVAFSVYLPTYLKNAYGLTQNGAAMRTAGFVVVAVLMRPLGGWLSDRFHPTPVLTACFGVVTALAVLAAFELALVPFGTIAFLGMAAALGAGAGATFALVARLSPQGKVGSVTGVVGAAGGLGGFVPPLVMGSIYGSLNDYSLGYVLLAAMAAAAALYTWFVLHPADRR